MGTRWTIHLLPTGKPLRGETASRHHKHCIEVIERVTPLSLHVDAVRTFQARHSPSVGAVCAQIPGMQRTRREPAVFVCVIRDTSRLQLRPCGDKVRPCGDKVRPRGAKTMLPWRCRRSRSAATTTLLYGVPTAHMPQRRATARTLSMHKVRAMAWRPRRHHGVQWICSCVLGDPSARNMTFCIPWTPHGLCEGTGVTGL